MSSKYNGTGGHMISQRLCKHTQDLYMFKSHGVLALIGGSGHGFLLLDKKLSVI